MDAIQESGYVYINISDDGAGIDPAKIRRKVVEKALLSESRALVTPDTEIINYIYEPGFSTSAIITDNSGRGVGMDVVKKNIERLGGQVSVTSESMVGTIFTLKVPLTIATSRALLVKVEEQTYAIPAPSIEQMLYLTPSDITTRAGRDVVMHGNALIPVIKLAELLGRNANREHPLFRWQTLNSVRAQDLNGRGLTTRLTNGNGNHPADSFLGLTLADPEARKQIIKIQTETPAKTSSRYSFERMPAVVVGSRERRFCLLVESLEDETEIVVKSLSSMLRVPHINSATILGDGRVVLILDVPNIIASARVMTSQNRLKASQSFDNKPTQKRILVVDDSITTRELEKSILEASGYHVDTADDGTVALDILLAGNSYDLLISDIEMPRMNGFELTALIKANPNLKQLPVIIVSSLNNDDQKRQGIKAGAQAYITKGDFNQNNLLSTIEYLTG
jgi:CheY-like chemotaxis protein